MAYTTSVRTVLKNVNSDKIGTLFLEIVFIDSDTKKKSDDTSTPNRRYMKMMWLKQS